MEAPTSTFSAKATLSPLHLTTLNTFLENPSITNLHHVVKTLSNGQCEVEKSEFGYMVYNKLYDLAMAKKANIAGKSNLSRITSADIIRAVESTVLNHAELDTIKKRLSIYMKENGRIPELGLIEATDDNDTSTYFRTKKLKMIADEFSQNMR